MAKQLNVDLRFNANTANAKQSVAELSKSLEELTKPRQVEGISTASLKAASKAAQELQGHLANAVNVNTGKLDLHRFSQSLSKSNTDMQTLALNLSRAGSQGQQAFTNLVKNINMADKSMIGLGSKMTDFATTLKNTARWQISSSILHGFMGTIQSAVGYAERLNASLNNIRIVTGASTSEMAAFAEKANVAAKNLSATTTAYTDAALIYYQQGLTGKAVEERAEVTLKLANVSRQSAEVVSQQMTGIWNNFADGSKSLEYYADVLTKLGATTASSTQEIATGLEKFAAVADTVGLSYEHASAALATITATTRQSADVVGTALKTLFARIQDLEVGKTLEDGTTLGKYSQALASMGVEIKDINGEVRSMDDILDDMGSKWGGLSKDMQIAVAQTVAGTRQYTQLLALMDNWDFMEKNLKTARGAEGELQRQQDIYAEGWEAAAKRVRASMEALFSDFLKDDFFIGLNNGLAEFLSLIDNVIDGVGGLKTILMGLGAVFMARFAKEMPSVLNNLAASLGVVTGKAAQNQQAMLQQTAQAARIMGQSDSVEKQILGKGLAQSTELSAKLQANLSSLSKAEIAEAQAKIQQIQASTEYAAAIGKEIDMINQASQARAKNMAQAAYSKEKEQAIKQYTEARRDKKAAIELGDKGETDAANKRMRDALDSYSAAQEKIRSTEKGLFEGVGAKAQEFGRVSAALKEAKQNSDQLGTSLKTAFQGTSVLAKQTALDQFKAGLKTIAAEVPGTSETIEQLMTKLNSITTDSSASEIEQLITELKELVGESGKAEEAVEKMKAKLENAKLKTMSELGDDNAQEIEDFVADQTSEGAQRYQADKVMPELDLEAAEHQMAKFSEKMMTLGSTIMSVTMAISALKSLGSIWSNDDLSTGEKIIQSLSAVSMLIMGLVPVYNMLTASKLKTSLASGVAAATQTAANVSFAAGIPILHGLTAGFIGAAAGVKAFFASLGPIGWAILGITAAVTALVAAFSVMNKASQEASLEGQLEKAKEKAEQFGNALSDARSEAEALNSAFDNYDSIKDKLAGCVEGTQAFRDALAEANSETSALLRDYPELVNYLESGPGGSKLVSQKGMDTLRQEADNKVTRLDIAKTQADLEVDDKELEVRANEIVQGLMNNPASLLKNVTVERLLAENLENIANVADKDLESYIEGLVGGKQDLFASGDQVKDIVSQLREGGYQDQIKSLVEQTDVNKQVKDIQQQLMTSSALAKNEKLQNSKYADDIVKSMTDDFQDFQDSAKEEVAKKFKSGSQIEKDDLAKKYLKDNNLGELESASSTQIKYKDESGESKTISTDQAAEYLALEGAMSSLNEAAEASLQTFTALDTAIGNSQKNINELSESAKKSRVGEDFAEGLKKAFEDDGSLENATMAQLNAIERAIESGNFEKSLEKIFGGPEGAKNFANQLGEDTVKGLQSSLQERTLEAKDIFGKLDFSGIELKGFDDLGVNAAAQLDKTLASLEKLNTIRDDRDKEIVDTASLQQYTDFLKDLTGVIDDPRLQGEALSRLASVDWTKGQAAANEMINILRDYGVEINSLDEDWLRFTQNMMLANDSFPSFESLIEQFTTLSEVIAGIDFGSVIDAAEHAALIGADPNLANLFMANGENSFEYLGTEQQLREATIEVILRQAAAYRETDEAMALTQSRMEQLAALAPDMEALNEIAGSIGLSDEAYEKGAISILGGLEGEDLLNQLSSLQGGLDALSDGSLAMLAGQFENASYEAERFKMALQGGDEAAIEAARNELELAVAAKGLADAYGESATAMEEFIVDIAEQNGLLDESGNIAEGAAGAAVAMANRYLRVANAVERAGKDLDGFNQGLADIRKYSSQGQGALSKMIPNLEDIREVTADIVGVNKDWIKNDFLANHGDKIAKAAAGDEKAIHSLVSAGVALKAEMAGVSSDIANEFANMMDSLPAGMELDPVITTNFVQSLADAGYFANMTADQIQEALARDFNIVTDLEPFIADMNTAAGVAEATGQRIADANTFYVETETQEIEQPGTVAEADVEAIEDEKTITAEGVRYDGSITAGGSLSFSGGAATTSADGSVSIAPVTPSSNIKVTGAINAQKGNQVSIKAPQYHQEATVNEQDASETKSVTGYRMKNPRSGGGGGNGGSGGLVKQNKGCFVAGTLITTISGFKPIENITSEDFVLSYNEMAQQVEYNKVKQTMIHFVKEDIYTLYIGSEKIETTGNHPFYLVKNGIGYWKEASNIQIGDYVLFADKTLCQVSGIGKQLKKTTVYNFEVENNHNYFISKSQILVHNKGGGSCFVPGTLISTKDGYKNIENINIGDIVLSYNEKTMKNEYNYVLQIMKHETKEDIYTLYIEDDQIQSTGTHPFYIIRNGIEHWMEVSNAAIGDFVLFADGTYHKIIRIDIQEKEQIVYNMEVDKVHTYYVGKNQVLVHNKGGGGNRCFVEGTLVAKPDYQEKIENLKTGDIVLSYNEETQKVEYSYVVRTMKHETTENIYTLCIDNITIQATGTHPFYILRNNQIFWMNVADIQVGDFVLYSDSSWHKIKQINFEKQTRVVYNLEVADNHNYYVSENQVLVHNKGKGRGRGRGRGGGGGGRVNNVSTKQATNKDRGEIQRYHVVDSRLKGITHNYTKLEKARNRVFGAQYVKNLEKEIKLMQKQIRLYREYLAENRKHINEDKRRIVTGQLKEYEYTDTNGNTIVKKANFGGVSLFNALSDTQSFSKRDRNGNKNGTQTLAEIYANAEKGGGTKGGITYIHDNGTYGNLRALDIEKLFQGYQVSAWDEVKGLYEYEYLGDEIAKQRALDALYVANQAFGIDADGNLLNWEEMQNALYDSLERATADYNAIQAQYRDQPESDAIKASLQEAENEKNYWEKQFEVFQQFIEVFEESVDKSRELKESFIEMIDNIQTLEFEKLQYKIEQQIKILDQERAILELRMSRIEDDWTKTVELMNMTFQPWADGANKGNNLYGLIRQLVYADGTPGTYKQDISAIVGGLWEEGSEKFIQGAEALRIMSDIISTQKYEKLSNEEITEMFKDSGINQQMYIEILDEIFEHYQTSAEELIELNKTMKGYYKQAMDGALGYLNSFVKQMEQNKGILEYYKTLNDLLGRTFLPERYISNAMTIYSARDSMYQNDISIAQSEYDMWAERLAAAEEFYATIEDKNSEEAKIYRENVIEPTRDAAMDAQNRVFDALVNRIENAREKAEVEINEIYRKLESQTTRGLGWDHLSTLMDLSREHADNYLTTTQKIYETNTLLNKIAKDRDKMENAAGKARLSEFAKEIQQLQNKNQLSKDEWEVAKARYEILQAEIALEEARDSKTQVRLQRDSQGNYGYVYTLNDADVDDKKQKVMDATNNLYELVKQQEEESLQRIAQLQQEVMAAQQDLNNQLLNNEITYEEYQMRMQELLSAYNVAMYDEEKNFNFNRNILEREFSDKRKDRWTDEYEWIAKEVNTFKTNFAVAQTDNEKALKEFDKVREEVYDNSMANLENLEDEVADLTNENASLADEIVGDVIPSIESLMITVQQATETWLKELAAINEVIDALLRYMETINTMNKEAMVDWDPNIDYSIEIRKALKENGYDINDPVVQELLEKRQAKRQWGGYMHTQNNSDLLQDIMSEYVYEYGLDATNKDDAKLAAFSDTINEWQDRDLVDQTDSNTLIQNSYTDAWGARGADDDFLRGDVQEEVDTKYGGDYSASLDSFFRWIGQGGKFKFTVDMLKGFADINPRLMEKIAGRNAKIIQNGLGGEWPAQTIREYLEKYGLLLDDNSSVDWSAQIGFFMDWAGQPEYLNIAKGDWTPEKFNSASLLALMWAEREKKIAADPNLAQWSTTLEDWLKNNGWMASFATGGYTGAWNSNGKLAILHEKELILNQQDTQNILDAVMMIRELSNAIDLQTLRYGISNGLQLPSFGANSNAAIAQEITIHAEFPSATNHSEIEEAFNSLLNRAVQYAGISQD